MASVYPGALDPLKTDVDGATDTLASVPHDALHNDANAAIKAVQATLGTNPQGAAATVAARLAALSAYELRGAGSPYGVITPAAAGIYYTDTAATNGVIRWVSTGPTATSWIVVYGDTGWRNITSLATASGLIVMNSADTIALRRIGSVVFFASGAFHTTFTSGQSQIFAWPAGFKKSPNGPSSLLLAKQSTVAMAGLGNFHESGFYLTGPGNTTDLLVVPPMSFVTSDSWPTTLPGTPA